jgi:hypothetical protein
MWKANPGFLRKIRRPFRWRAVRRIWEDQIKFRLICFDCEEEEAAEEDYEDDNDPNGDWNNYLIKPTGQASS